MKKRLTLAKNYIKKDDFTRYSTMMYISTLFSGGFNYVYQVYMGRTLGPGEYGIFGALFGIFYMIEVIASTLMTSTTQFVAKFLGEGKDIGSFIKSSMRHMLIVGMVASIIFSLLTNWIVDILKLQNHWPVLILIIILFLTWISPIINGALRGAGQFLAICLSNISNAFFKLLFGILLVTMGFGVSGAMFGIVAGIFFSMLVGYIFLEPFIFSNNLNGANFRFSSFYSYSIPVMVAMFGYSVPANLDVILVKYFFSANDAGLYTSVSVLGKIILFSSVAICGVMFQMISERHAKKENTTNMLRKSLLYSGLVSGIVTSVYILYPEIIVKIFGNRYIGAMNIMTTYGVAMFFFSITTTIMYYHLAIRNMRYVVIFVGFTLLEISLFLTFHSSISEMTYILLIMNMMLSIVSVLYTAIHCKRIRNMTHV